MKLLHINLHPNPSDFLAAVTFDQSPSNRMDSCFSQKQVGTLHIIQCRGIPYSSFGLLEDIRSFLTSAGWWPSKSDSTVLNGLLVGATNGTSVLTEDGDLVAELKRGKISHAAVSGDFRNSSLRETLETGHTIDVSAIEFSKGIVNAGFSVSLISKLTGSDATVLRLAHNIPEAIRLEPLGTILENAAAAQSRATIIRGMLAGREPSERNPT